MSDLNPEEVSSVIRSERTLPDPPPYETNTDPPNAFKGRPGPLPFPSMANFAVRFPAATIELITLPPLAELSDRELVRELLSLQTLYEEVLRVGAQVETDADDAKAAYEQKRLALLSDDPKSLGPNADAREGQIRHILHADLAARNAHERNRDTARLNVKLVAARREYLLALAHTIAQAGGIA